MADIRSYTREKEKREKQNKIKQSRLRLVKSEDEDSFQDKIHRHRLSFFYRILLMVLVCGALVALVAVQYRNKTYTDYEVLSDPCIDIVAGNTSLRLGSNVLIYSKDGARCVDTAGNVLWNQTYEMQSPIVATCGSAVAIGDYNGRTIYIQNAEKQLGTVSTNLPIRNLCVAANGVAAAVLEDTTVTWIYVYDASGNELVKFRTSMKDTGYPVSVSLSPNALLCTVSYVYVDAGTLKSSVAFYNFDEYGKTRSTIWWAATIIRTRWFPMCGSSTTAARLPWGTTVSCFTAAARSRSFCPDISLRRRSGVCITARIMWE